jgi:hypothetical protein
MAFDVAAIRDGVKTRLATITGLRCYDTIPDRDIVVPAAVVQPSAIRYQEAFKGGLVEARMRITIITSAGTDRVGQDQLDAYLSAGTGMTKSIVDALEGDKTLNGSADSSGIEVEHEIDYGKTVINEITYWKADVDLKVLRERQ